MTVLYNVVGAATVYKTVKSKYHNSKKEAYYTIS